MINLPLIGQITAGEPIFAEQNIEEYIPLPASLVSVKDNFVLRVKGESMIYAGILDGDYVVVDKKNTAANGTMVAALVENEKATVKTFYREDGKIRDNFVLRVKGESMINAGILDGDYVVVDKKNTAANGTMVAALVENEKATVKTFYKEDGKIRLQPENEFMEPFIFEDSQVQIIGVVTGVFRVLK